jgi:hypothetical protein
MHATFGATPGWWWKKSKNRTPVMVALPVELFECPLDRLRAGRDKRLPWL